MAATENSDCGQIPRLSEPPHVPDQPYILPSLEGEIIYIPCSRSAMRLLVTGKENDNAFAVVGTGGASADPIGFHYHNHAHDVFLCIKGQMNVWAGSEARTLGPGDFASVPSKVIHQYQILGPHTEFLGVIVPGGWEEFFRFIGEPYSGPLFPLTDNRNVFEVLIPKLKAAAEQFDMVPCPSHEGFTPQAWNESEAVLPGAPQAYFLKNGSAPATEMGGIIMQLLAGVEETNGRFTVGAIQGSAVHRENSLFHLCKKGVVFINTQHCFQVAEGVAEFTVDGTTGLLTSGEIVYVPSRKFFSFRFLSKFTKMYCFASGAGLNMLLQQGGQPYHNIVLPETAEPWDSSKLEALKEKHEFNLV